MERSCRNTKRSRGNPTGADKERRSNQQNITSFFNKERTQLFSTIRPSNKGGDKRAMNLLTRKKCSFKEDKSSESDVEGGIDRKSRRQEKMTLETNELLCLAGAIDGINSKTHDKEVQSNLQPHHCNEQQNATKTMADYNSDDDLIPPTPSPAGLSRSFMKSTSLSSSEEHDTPKRQMFTNLKLKQVILEKEEEEKRKHLLKVRALALSNESKSSLTKASVLAKIDGGALEGNFSKGEKNRNLDINVNSKGENHKLKNICRPGFSDDSQTNAAKKLKTGNVSISSTYKMIGSQKYKPNSSMKDTQPKSFTTTITTPSAVSDKKKPESATLSSEVINTNMNEDDSSRPLLAPSKIVLKKSKSFKRPGSKGISPSKKRHQGEPSFLPKGSSTIPAETRKQNSQLCGPDESDDVDMRQYGAEMPSVEHLLTCRTKENGASSFPLNLYSEEKFKTEENCKETTVEEEEEEEEQEDSDFLEGNINEIFGATPAITPWKTPIKDTDRHVITDISLITPTKNSPNTSRDSLLGVELEGLMDGLEWSPVPKKSSARTKLFVEYTPYSSPYRRFLVLEVYKRKANREEALSKYGRVLSEKVLRLFDEGRSVERYCYLRQDWEMTEIEPGDLVHVTGDFHDISGVCILDNQTDQYIVVHPDTLVSGTTVAGATRCLRRTILNERFRTEDTNEAMLIGTLLHDLFDKAMQANEFSKEKLVTMAKELLQQHSYLNSLYSIGMSEVAALDKISESIPAFSDWSKRYVVPFPDPDVSLMDYKSAFDDVDSSEQPSVCISALKDIEENVWSPRFGLKGKVDATVEVKIDRRPRIRRHKPDKDNSVQTSVIPLELKTGKLFSKLGSVDHRAQAILYTLLLSDRHRHPVDSGLLYYMKSGHIIGVPALVHEKRALVMRRNEVARYLSLSRTTGGFKMPGMLKDVHTCSRCSQAQNCTLFHKSVENGNPVTSGLGELFDKLTQQLTPDHARYFADWFKLVCLEGKEVLQSGKSSQHHIWSMEGLEREALGQCFSGMVQTSREHQMDKIGIYLHSFGRSPDHPSQTPLLDVPITAGDRVVVSEERNSAVAIATGYIREVTASEVVVSLDRDLSKCYRSRDILHQTPIYRLDKDEGYNSLVTPWSNVAKLFSKDSKRNADLRRLIIDLKPPVFARSRQALINFGSQSSVGSLNVDSQASSNSSQTSSTPKYQDTVVESLMQDLNKDQKQAIVKVLSAQDYTLILGMPGTGKTTTIARLVQILVASGKTVLLTSYTHTAVDNILLKIKQAGLDFLRLGQVHKLLPEIQPYSAEVGAADIKTVNKLRDFYASKAVVATTCLGVNHALFSQQSFDYCIVDEASQITQPVCLGPLRHADVFVLVGDHYQLPPLVQSLEAREGGMDVSLFKRLSEHNPQAVVCLEHQYRMNKDIMALSNKLIYEERLRCGTLEVANALLNIPQWDELASWFSTKAWSTIDNWLLRAIDPRHPVVFLNTDHVPAYETRSGHLVTNETEAILIQQLTCALRLGGVDSTSIGIISPYRQQLKLIKELLRQDSRESQEDLEINTVDKYQGRDKPCILVSLVRSNDTSSVGDLLKDWRRVNVAVTRAKSKLILIGSLNTLRASLLLNELIDLVEGNHWVHELPKDAQKMFVDLTRSLEERVS